MGARIAVLASGSGTTAQALFDASKAGELGDGEVVLLLSDRADAPVLERARAAGIDAKVLDPDGLDRAAYGEKILAELTSAGIDFICSAGFMRILAPAVVHQFSGRLLNTHPSLLPAFPGAHPVRDTLEHGAKVTGATVHFIDEGVDSGPIVMQEAVPVLPGDDEATLHERIKQVERRIFPKAVRLAIGGHLRVEGRTVKVEEEAS